MVDRLTQERNHFVYWAYDHEDRLLYVGMTRAPRSRWLAHRTSSDWETYATRFKMAGPYSEDAARLRERKEIFERAPFFNVAHNVRLYAQFVQEERERRIRNQQDPELRLLPKRFDVWWRHDNYRRATAA